LPHAVGEEEAIVYPLKLGSRAGCVDASAEHGSEGSVSDRCGYVERSGDTRLQASQREGRQVPDVYWLDLTVTVSRGQHVTARGDPGEPPCQPTDILLRAEDDTRPEDQHMAAERPRNGAFAACLVGAVLRG
jgi:hypothetical protein